jgi:hypothetical protein
MVRIETWLDMQRCTDEKCSRSVAVHAALLIAGLIVPLVLEWGRDGPPADRAFSLVMTYFAELALWIAADLLIGFMRSARHAPQ